MSTEQWLGITDDVTVRVCWQTPVSDRGRMRVRATVEVPPTCAVCGTDDAMESAQVGTTIYVSCGRCAPELTTFTLPAVVYTPPARS